MDRRAEECVFRGGVRRGIALVLLLSMAFVGALGLNAERVIGLVGPGEGEAGWTWSVAGLRDRAAEMPGAAGWRFVEITPLDRSTEAQLEAVQSLVRRDDLAALVLAPTADLDLGWAARLLALERIPVLTLGRGLAGPGAENVVWTGAVDRTEAWAWQQRLAFQLIRGGNGRVGVFDGAAENPFATWADPAVDRRPPTGQWSWHIEPAEADGWLVLRSEPLLDRRRLGEWRTRGPVIAGVGDALALARLESGDLDAIVMPDFYGLGRVAAEALAQALTPGTPPTSPLPAASPAQSAAPEIRVQPFPLVLTSANLPHWKALWQRHQR